MNTLDLREYSRQHMPNIEVDEHLRQAAIHTWKARMVNEHGSAQVFEGLYQQFSRLGVEPKELQNLLDFAAEERRHGVLCGAVVEALGGQAIAPSLPVVPFPEHPDATPIEAALRNLISISCLSETVAVALIGAERLEMPDGELKDLLTKIYADECGHANFGWRLVSNLLAQQSAELKARLGEYLIVAFAHLEQHELRHLPVESNPPPEGAKIGLCSGADARKLFYATVEQIIIPGLEKSGLLAQQAWNRRQEAGDVLN